MLHRRMYSVQVGIAGNASWKQTHSQLFLPIAKNHYQIVTRTDLYIFTPYLCRFLRLFLSLGGKDHLLSEQLVMRIFLGSEPSAAQSGYKVLRRNGEAKSYSILIGNSPLGRKNSSRNKMSIWLSCQYAGMA